MNSDLPAKMEVRKMLEGNIHEAGKFSIEKGKQPNRVFDLAAG